VPPEDGWNAFHVRRFYGPETRNGPCSGGKYHQIVTRNYKNIFIIKLSFARWAGCPIVKIKFHLSAAVAPVVLMLASCGPQLDMTSVPMSSGAVAKSDGSLAGNIHSQVNAHRGAIGKPSLPRHAGLDRMAQQHSEFMMRNRDKIEGGLSHYGFEERAMAAQRLMSMSNVAENIATCSGGFTSPTSTLVEAWKNSSGHAMNMKNNWDATGVGVAVAPDGTVFATQIFATQSQSHMAMTDRLRQF
jgi:uncharacterized protein YkwD